MDGFNFWGQYQKAVETMLREMKDEIKVEHTHTHNTHTHTETHTHTRLKHGDVGYHLVCCASQTKSAGNDTVRAILEKDYQEQKVCEREFVGACL